MILLTSVGVFSVPEGTLRQAIEQSGLPKTASKQQILRFALLRLTKGAAKAREIVFGDSDLSEVNGRVYAKMPADEVEEVLAAFPGASISELARYGLRLTAGDVDHDAAKAMIVQRGPKPGQAKPTRMKSRALLTREELEAAKQGAAV